MKILAASICILPLGGCALGIGLIFMGLLYGISRNPMAYDSVFGLSLLGLAMIELFAFICIIGACVIVILF
jgi:F0F1-type ATP synthase membrane subunit c/vacuolar-type H+-ATPase subunit K